MKRIHTVKHLLVYLVVVQVVLRDLLHHLTVMDNDFLTEVLKNLATGRFMDMSEESLDKVFKEIVDNYPELNWSVLDDSPF